MEAKLAKPFVKWVGGKRQLLPTLLPLFPEKINTYYEPFVGAGAVFYALAEEKRFDEALINDWNKELISAYLSIQNHVPELCAKLEILAAEYKTDPKGTFDRVRAEVQTEQVAIAARFIFLNKTCFNGLYRVNQKGQFNTPIGKFSSPPNICDTENLLACSKALTQVVITQGDFMRCALPAKPGDVVYFDPPYVPLNPTSNFTSYTAEGFNYKDQERLALRFRDLADQGVDVVASNSDTEVVRNLYQGLRIIEVQARRSVNSKGGSRGPIGELIIVGGPNAAR